MILSLGLRICPALAVCAILAAGEVWTGTTLGSAAPGAHADNAGTWTLTSHGGSMWGRSDGAYVVTQPVTGDVTITARVMSVTNTDLWAKAGVMLRATTATDSICVMAYQSAAKGRALQWRSQTGGSTSQRNATAAGAPGWVRLRRVGTSVTGYHSADGVTWTQIGGPLTIPFGASLLAGLAVSPNTASATCQGVFSNVSIQAAGAPVDQPPVVTLASTLTVGGPGATIPATISDDGGTPTIAWSLDAAASAAAVRIANSAVEDPAVTFPRNGAYVLRVAATDARGQRTERTITVTVAAPGSFAISGTVLDGGTAPAPAVVTRLLWQPLAGAEVGRSTTAADGSFAHTGLIGSPLDFEVLVPGSP